MAEEITENWKHVLINGKSKTLEVKDSDFDKGRLVELNDSIFLIVDYQKRDLSIPIIKQAADGYKTVVCRVSGKKMDRFEFMMTLFRVWPFILEKKEQLNTNTILTFPYGGRRLKSYDIAN